jgi:hypothetical protein
MRRKRERKKRKEKRRKQIKKKIQKSNANKKQRDNKRGIKQNKLFCNTSVLLFIKHRKSIISLVNDGNYDFFLNKVKSVLRTNIELMQIDFFSLKKHWYKMSVIHISQNKVICCNTLPM